MNIEEGNRIAEHPKEIPSNMSVVSIADDTFLTFIHIPKGFEQKKFEVDNAVSISIGYLSSFNRIKKIAKWKTKQHPDLVDVFTKCLQQNGWDFTQYPNPYCTLTKVNSQPKTK